MPKSLGQVVYLFKDKLPNELNRTDCHNFSMAQRAPRQQIAVPPAPTQERKWKAPPKALFARNLGARLKDAREKKGLTQEQMADELGIRQSVYSKYESRGGDKPPTSIPHIYLAKFSEITGASVKDLLKDPR